MDNNINCKHSKCEFVRIEKVGSNTEIGECVCWDCYSRCAVWRKGIFCLKTAQWRVSAPNCQRPVEHVTVIKRVNLFTELGKWKCWNCYKGHYVQRNKCFSLTTEWKPYIGPISTLSGS